MKCDISTCLWNCFLVGLLAITLYLVAYVVIYIILVKEVNSRYSNDLIAQREQQLSAIK